MSDLQLHGLLPARLLCPWAFSRQEYWSGLPFPSPGDLPNPWIKPVTPASSALAGGCFNTDPPRKPKIWYTLPDINCYKLFALLETVVRSKTAGRTIM